jgi:hypothetical protein
MNPPRVLELLDLAWALGLIAISIGLLQWQRVGIGGQLALAADLAIKSATGDDRWDLCACPHDHNCRQ